ncbi:MAG: cupin [Cyanobacteria bacterium QS_8_64_29]|nr:MAG: cupin [Cyanobacteria bacterium QS_8_64_29]
MKGLTPLLAPYSLETFLAQYWGQQGLKLEAPDRTRFQHLFGWAQLNELLNYHDKPHPHFRLASDKKVLDASANDDFLKHCRNGATLIIDGVHKKIPAIAELASAVQYELGLGHSAQVNAYCSWSGKQGFDRHYDTHEVFILQIEGSKEWFVFDDTVGHPLAGSQTLPEQAPQGEPYIHTTLEPGDLLHIPRGHWHYALAQQEPSIHLTLGVRCHTGVDLVDWLKQELQQEPAWRQNLPPGTTELDSATLARYVDELAERLKARLASPTLSSEYADYLASQQSPFCNYSVPYQVGFGLDQIGPETVFNRPRYQRTFVTFLPEQGKHKIRCGRSEIKLKGVPRTFLDSVLGSDRFSGQDAWNWLPDYDWASEVQPLLAYLVREGVIAIERLGVSPSSDGAPAQALASQASQE